MATRAVLSGWQGLVLLLSAILADTCNSSLYGCGHRCPARCIACSSIFSGRLCSQMLDPPHCLHTLLMRLCSQMLAPQRCLHPLLRRLCSQMPSTLHCWQSLKIRLCSHVPDPSHCQHWLFGGFVRELCALHLRSFAACPATAHSVFMLLLLGLVGFLE
jgi:hypothetical protein